MVKNIITVFGIKNVLTTLAVKNFQISKKVQQGVQEATRFILGEVVQSAKGHRAEPMSVDTGLFSSNQGIKHKFPTKLSGEVFATVDYASHLEWGTRKFEGRHHFRNTKERNQSKVTKFISDKMKTI